MANQTIYYYVFWFIQFSKKRKDILKMVKVKIQFFIVDQGETVLTLFMLM